jgi:anti-sigma-K factor RskA
VICKDRQDLLLLYVTDALDADETREMRQHLQSGCPECAGYLAEAQSLLAAVPLGLEPVVPPAHLKEKLMQRIAAESQPLQAKQKVVTPAAAPASYRLFRYLIPTAIAAGLAIVVTRSLMLQRSNDLQRQSDYWQQKSADATTEIYQLKQLKTQFQSQTQVVELLQSPDVKLFSLKPTKDQPKAVANLLWDQKQQQWAILTTGMLPAAAGQTYELWFITQAGTKVAAGTFDVDSNGKGWLRVPVPADIGVIKVAAVTNEKTGGVPQPQGSIQVAGSVE